MDFLVRTSRLIIFLLYVLYLIYKPYLKLIEWKCFKVYAKNIDKRIILEERALLEINEGTSLRSFEQVTSAFDSGWIWVCLYTKVCTQVKAIHNGYSSMMKVIN